MCPFKDEMTDKKKIKKKKKDEMTESGQTGEQ